MKCTKCGVQNPDNSRFCTACGTHLPTMHYGTLILSAKEAKQGCQKDYFMPGMTAPIRFRLQPRIKNGQVLRVNNAVFYDSNGNAGNEPLQITVRVQRKKFKWWMPLVAVVGFLTVFGLFVELGNYLEEAGGSQTATVPDAQELIPNFELKYFLNALDADDLETVCLLYQSIMEFEEYCTMPDGVYEEDLVSLIPLLEAECPELFQVDFSQNIQYYFDKGSKEITEIEIPYRLDEDTYQDMLQECEAIIDEFVTDTAGLSDEDKEQYVFDSIASSCWYNMEAEHAGTAYGALVAGSAKCDGISLAMKWAMEAMGIQCLCITADCPGETVGHAWNIIKLNGNFYTLDLTMSVRNSTYVDAGIGDVIYFQYNVSDSWAQERYVIHEYLSDTAKIPECKNNDNSYYASIDMFVYSGEDPKEKLYSALQASAKSGKKIYFQFESDADKKDFLVNVQSMTQEWYLLQSQHYRSVRWNDLSFGVLMIEVDK